jgi:formate hydrogenlyase transcriptional activator
MTDLRESPANAPLDQRYEGLLKASQFLRPCANLGEILAALPAALAQLLQFDYLSLFTTPTGASQWFVRDQNSELGLVQVAEPPPESVLSDWVIAQGRPVLDLREIPDAQDTVKKMGMQSVCIIPLSGRRRRLGSLTVASRHADRYCSVDLQTLTLIGNLLSAALAIQDYQRRSDRAELILRINNSIASNLEVQALLRSVAGSLRQTLHCDFASVTIPDPTGTQLVSLAIDFPDSLGFIKEGNLIPIEGSVLGRVYQTAQRILIGPDRDPSDPVLAKGTAEGIKFACFCPLIRQNRTLGILAAGRRQDHPITEDEADLLMEVAHQVSIALDNATAYRQISELKDQLAQEKLYLEDEIRGELNFAEIVGDSTALRRVLKQVEIVAPTDSNVLIYGETGSGKELVARAIHDLSSRRSNTFVKLNCAAIPTGLLESELFGHEKGAFTGAVSQRIGRFELASRGTIFLDEVGEIPLELQPKLLRVLQEREFERLGSSRTLRSDARLIAATNRDLSAMVEKQTFRADLFYRLNVFPLYVPSLRQRPEDIPLLVRHFVHQFARRMNKSIDTIPTETMHALIRYQWPGNIRELQNLIERAMILTSGPVLRVPLEQLKSQPLPASLNATSQTLEENERAHILAILKETKWVLSGPAGAAARLGMNRSTLRFRMGKLGITRPGMQ